MKQPATQLNDFFNKLAIWLKANQPDFVDKYSVSASQFGGKADDESVIKIYLNFHVSNKKIEKLHESEMVEKVEDGA